MDTNKDERVSTPTLCVDKLKNILLYIISKYENRYNFEKSYLQGLLYFCEFNYYEIYEEHLTGIKFHKSDYGLLSQDLDNILNQMIEDKEIKYIETSSHICSHTYYFSLVEPNLSMIQSNEKETIDRVIEKMGEWSTTSINDYTSRDLPYKASKKDEEINYELVFYRDAIFSVRDY